ncbi:MAG: sugar phosphate isomerase/epimerase [Clostridia bacterium]|nr:sugar phosphate isomerase/epimerase [Clostridia bacterium]
MKKAFSLSYTSCHNDVLLSELQDAGFTGIDLGFFNDVSMLKGDVDANIHELQTILSKHNMTVFQVHLPAYNIFASSETEDTELEQHMKTSFYVMSELGVKWGAFHPMSSTNYDYDRKRAMTDNRERLKKHLETAEKLGVGIAVENLPIFPDCPQYHFFTSDNEDLIELVDSLQSDKIGVCWDTGHANLMPYNQANIMDELGERIKILHVHNNSKEMDLHLCPAIGTIPWHEVMPVLSKHNFSGDMTLEVTLYQNMLCRKEYLSLCGKSADELCKMLKA